MQPQPSKPSIAIPAAIVIGFALIAAAIFFSGNKTVAPTAQTGTTPPVATKAEVRPVDKTDFVRGNPNAPIMVIEYSDYDCPFCKQFNDTMTQIMKDYGVTGKVGWVYRQFPIPQLHPNAPKISEAAYCVADQGGSEAFWKFSDLVFGEREVNEKTNMTRLPEYAEKSGVKRAAFTTCLDSGKFKATVDKSVAEAALAGAQGTPYSIVVVGDQQVVINGAQPYAVVKQMIDNVVKQLDGSSVGAAATTTR